MSEEIIGTVSDFFARPVVAGIELTAGLKVGDRIQMWGRVQSRDYEKKLESGVAEKRVAYEVSISKIKKLDENNIN